MYSISERLESFLEVFDVYSISSINVNQRFLKREWARSKRWKFSLETFSNSLGQDFPKLDPKFMAKKSCSRQNNRTHISQIEQTQQVVNWYE